jgi:hypothetical protein
MTYQRPGARLVANGATTVFTQPSREEVAIVRLPLEPCHPASPKTLFAAIAHLPSTPHRLLRTLASAAPIGFSPGSWANFERTFTCGTASGEHRSNFSLNPLVRLPDPIDLSQLPAIPGGQ